MISLLSSKKAQVENYLAVIIFLFVFGISSIFAYLWMTNFITVFTATGFYVGTVASTGDSFLAGLRLFDNIIILVMTVLIIGVGITSFRLAAVPAGYIITFVMAAMYGLISYFFNYIFAQIVSNVAFSTVIMFFPGTILILTNLHWVMLVMIVIGSITLYAKNPSGGQYLT